MVIANDRINDEFYVDQVIKYLLKSSQVVRTIEVDRYLPWGTPEDYENYQQTVSYWTDFISKEDWVI